jgi:hypothetical protein
MSRLAKSMDRVASGIFVRGKVVRRSKREVGTEKKEVVTYGIMLESTVVELTDWQPTSYFDVGDEVEIPVMVRVYTGKTGRVGWNLARDDGPRGAF